MISHVGQFDGPVSHQSPGARIISLVERNVNEWQNKLLLVEAILDSGSVFAVGVGRRYWF
jgi:hypothetical protein